MEKGNNNVIRIVVGVIAVVAVISIIVGVVFLTKNNKTTESGNNSSQTNNNETKKNDTKNADVVMYINDYKIVLGKTKISDIVENSKLTLVCHKVDTFTDSKTNKTVEYDYYKFTDGVNIIHLQSVTDKLDIVNSINTLKDFSVNAPAFDSSKGTTISVDDVNFRNGIKIGDTLTEDDSLDRSKLLVARNIIYSKQSEDEGKITYYKDSNDVIINILADAGYPVFSSTSCDAE